VLERPHGHAFYEVVKNGTSKLIEQMADDVRPPGVACVAVSPRPAWSANTASPTLTGNSNRPSGTGAGAHTCPQIS
jgi:hypothetical protein